MITEGSRQADNINSVLGPRAGVLELVFRLLPLQDLKNVRLVCHLWREAGGAVLWARGVLMVTRENQARVVEAMDKGLQAVRKISVNRGVSEELLEAIASHSTVRSVHMPSSDLSDVEPELLARVLAELVEVDMSRSRLDKQLAEAVITAVCVAGSTLENLNISWSNLFSLDKGLLATAVSRLKEVNLSMTGLTQEQKLEILLGVCAENSQLKTLNIGGINFSTVDGGLLARAVTPLDHVYMGMTQLTSQQAEEILTAVCAQGSALKTLDIRGNRLSLVEEGLVARAVTSLKQVNLGDTELTQRQAEEIFTAISERDCQLENLDLQGSNLSSVEPNILARTLNSLKEASFANTELTEVQTDALLNAISAGHSKLRTLDIQYNTLSLAEPALLVSAVTSVENVNLSGTKLTEQQLVAILYILAFVGSFKLKTLNLSSNTLSLVEVGLLAKGVNSLEEVVLSDTKLSQQQAEAILTESLMNTSLKKLDMRFGYGFTWPCALDKNLVAMIRLNNRRFLL